MRRWRNSLRNRPWLTVGLLTVVAGAVRFGTLSIQSLWLDEVLSLQVIRGGFLHLPRHVLYTQTSPPLYFALARLWSEVFGTSPVAVRAFSATCGTLLVPILYLAGRRLGERAGLWAAAFGAASGELFYFSQEIRGYELFVLLSAIAFVLWQRALDTPSRRNLNRFSAVSALAVLTHYFGAAMFAAQVAVLARRSPWRRLVAPVGAYGVIAAAMAVFGLQQEPGKLNFIASSPLLGRAAQVGKELIAGPYGPFAPPLPVICGILTVAGLALAYRYRPPDLTSRIIEIAAAGAGAAALPLLAALLGIADLVLARNFIACIVPLIVLVAAGCAWTPRGEWLGGALVAALCVIVIGTLALPEYQRDDWRDAAAALGRPAALPRVLVAGHYGSTTLGFYLRDTRPWPSAARSLETREIDLVFLRRVHGGLWEPNQDAVMPPLGPAGPASPPPAGFRLLGKRRAAPYATYRYVSPAPIGVTPGELRRMMGERTADLAVQS